MTTRDEYVNALRKADAAGDVAAAKAIARKIQSIGSPATTPAEAEREPGGFLAFFNKKIASIVGAPVDITSGIMRNLPIGGTPDPRLVRFGLPQRASPEQSAEARKAREALAPEDSFGGSESVRRGLAATGAPTPDRAPETALEHMGSIAGDAVAFTAPIVKFGQGATALKQVGTGRAIAKRVSDFHAKSPVTAAVSEAGGVVGAGLMRDVAEKNELGPGASMGLEVAGGVAGSVLAPVATGVSALKMGFASFRALGADGVMPWTRKGGTVRAARHVQALADDPVAAAEAVTKHQEGYLSPAARTGDKELLALEKEIIQLDPSKATALAARGSTAANVLARSLGGEGDVRDLASFVSDQRRRLFQAMDDSVSLAKKQANQLIERAGSKVDADTASRITQEAMDISKDAAKRQETILWDAIPETASVPFKNFRKTYESIVAKTASSLKGSIPREADEFLRTLKDPKTGEFIKKTTTVNELDGQYKALGEFIQQAERRPSSTAAGIARRLRSAILKDMEDVIGTDAEKALVGTARAFSRRLNSVFKDGPVGDVLKRGAGARLDIPAELALKKTVEAGGQTGAFAQRAIQDTGEFAAREGFGPVETQAVDNVDQFLRSKFTDAAIKDGDFNPPAAKSFLKKHGQTLDKYPETKKQIEEFIQSADAFIEKGKSTEAFKKAATKASSSVQKIVEGDVVNEVGKAMKSPDPVAGIEVLINTAKGNEKAMQGLRKATGDWLMDSITTGRISDASGLPVIDASKFIRTVNDPKIRPALGRIYGKGMSRLDGIGKRLHLLEKQAKSKGGIVIDPDEAGWMLKLAGTWAGTRAGAKLGKGGASLKLASAGSNIMKTFLDTMMKGQMRKVLLDAVDDPELYKALLTHNLKDPVAQAKATSLLKTWMLGTGSHYFTPEQLKDISAENPQ